jgi:tRNA U55 pseudouridine synthase TruB
LRAKEVEAVAGRFRGVLEQTPPPFSPKKIHGVPAYKLARQQKNVVLKPVQVEIKEFVILGAEVDRARFRARVASGTYMRSVAHEMGRELACGAHLESRRRISVAEFNLEDAHTLEEVAGAAAASGSPARQVKVFSGQRELIAIATRDSRHAIPSKNRAVWSGSFGAALNLATSPFSVTRPPSARCSRFSGQDCRLFRPVPIVLGHS